jgi:hypothetical protein
LPHLRETVLKTTTSQQQDGAPPHYAVPGTEYRGADKSLAQPGKKKSTATEDFEFHISYL